MKYICKQKTPFCDVGEEVSVRERCISDNSGYKGYEITVNGRYHDWPSGYAPIEDWFEPKRWMPRLEDDFWFVYADGGIGHIISLNGSLRMDHYNFGNCFETKEQAEKARLLVLEALKKAHE